MKTITITQYRTYKQTNEIVIEKVVHDIPTWIFEESFGGQLKNPCPVCHKEMRLNIAHGAYIETCSVISLQHGPVFPIHTNCFNGLTDNQ